MCLQDWIRGTGNSIRHKFPFHLMIQVKYVLNILLMSSVANTERSMASVHDIIMEMEGMHISFSQLVLHFRCDSHVLNQMPCIVKIILRSGIGMEI